MRTFGNASLMDRSGASSLSSVDSELMSSLTWMYISSYPLFATKSTSFWYSFPT